MEVWKWRALDAEGDGELILHRFSSFVHHGSLAAGYNSAPHCSSTLENSTRVGPTLGKLFSYTLKTETRGKSSAISYVRANCEM